MLALVMWLLVGCDTTHVETVSSALSVRYLAGCAPPRVDAITVEALGDFPVRRDSLVLFDARSGEGELRGLPVSAQLFRLRVSTASFAGVAIAPADDANARFDALVLPLGVHCPVMSEGGWNLESESVLALPGGDLLVAGGVAPGEGPQARRDAQRISVSRARVDVIPEGMFLPRALAASVIVGDEAWILGGAPNVVDGSALDNFERFANGAFQAPGRLAVARARPGAVRLLDGSVLVAGGQNAADNGLGLDSLERISVEGESRLLEARLPWGAVEPALFVRDDGLVWIVVASRDGHAVALFDPVSEEVAAIDTPLDGLDAGPLVALPGSRLALFEIEASATTGALHLLLPDLSLVRLDSWLTSFSGITNAVVASLRDGRILLTGLSRAESAEALARVIDVGRREVRVRELEGAVDTLVPRDDGSVAELGSGGLRVVREDERTRFDNPGGTLLADDADVLALDAHTRWRRDGLELEALADGARFELASLTYEDVNIDLDMAGEGELVLRRADGAARALAMAPDQVGPALCRLARSSEGPVRIERRGDEVRIEAGGEAQNCHLEGMIGPVSLGFRALSAGTRLKNLIVTRD